MDFFFFFNCKTDRFKSSLFVRISTPNAGLKRTPRDQESEALLAETAGRPGCFECLTSCVALMRAAAHARVKAVLCWSG